MTYVESNLMPGEQIVAIAKVHWWVYAPGVFLLLIGLALVNQTGGFGWFLIMSALFLSIRAWLLSYTTELAITNKRVIAKFGFISRSTIELLHAKVEGFHVEQSIMGRTLNFGTVVVNGTGASKTPIPRIAAPLEFRKSALGAIEANPKA